MVVQRRHLDAAGQQLRHHRADLVHRQHKIAMTIPLPALAKASQLPSANPGFSSTPSSVALMSVRGSPTLYTPPGSSVPAFPSASPTRVQPSSAASAEPISPAISATRAILISTDIVILPPGLVPDGVSPCFCSPDQSSDVIEIASKWV